ncbi:MAG: ABC transporter permease subunit [Albidovulum sp.]
MRTVLGNRKTRQKLLQFGFAGSLLIAVVFFVLTARANLEAQGMSSGFGFLERSTGWSIGFSFIPFTSSETYGRLLFVGFINTLVLAMIALALAMVIGVAVGVLRTVDHRMSRLIGTTYVEIFRNVPLILQLFVWYAIMKSLPQPRSAISWGDTVFITGRGIYLPGLNLPAGTGLIAGAVLLGGLALTIWCLRSKHLQRKSLHHARFMASAVALASVVMLSGLVVAGWPAEGPLLDVPALKGLNFRGGITLPVEFVTMIIALSVFGGAYVAEIIRAGFNAVPLGQTEAGKAIGLSTFQIFTRIRLPLAIRIVMPALINQMVWLVKATTLGVAIGFSDFFAVTVTSISQSGQTLELIAILMAGFLAINYSLAWVLNRVNDVIKLKGKQAWM